MTGLADTLKATNQFNYHCEKRSVGLGIIHDSEYTSGLFLTFWFKTNFNNNHNWSAATAAKSLQSCPTLCDPIDGSPPVSPVPGILQARTLEWVAISFSNAWKWKVKVKLFSNAWLLTTPRTVAYLAPLPMGFSRQEYWSGMPLPSPVILVVCNY